MTPFEQGYKTVLVKLGFQNPLTERGDFRDATPEEWREHQTNRSRRMVTALGALSGVAPGAALGYLAALAAGARKPALLGGATLLGGGAGALGSGALFRRMNRREASNISRKQWEEGLKRYNERWRELHPEAE